MCSASRVEKEVEVVPGITKGCMGALRVEACSRWEGVGSGMAAVEEGMRVKVPLPLPLPLPLLALALSWLWKAAALLLGLPVSSDSSSVASAAEDFAGV
jgi:hypothetical protein